ncbi:polysaccharide deacetylase family protein [Dictyobacter arantiisoli]|uniref:NodB homology domain-containing protein n=1 Tax=Dictyobacter arantiisoli TaxID=2014874 RepID=A0A5A5TB38_9CHLR|nr:polysaccharide deacetylase family protein [Dictyobacter arantiisoli]GCF08209.1 hypothetical protein KDI_17730 [Dictyobacter arantiisoli]
MYERLRIIAALFFYCTGITRLALWFKERSDPRLLILNYHNAGGNLASQLRYLKRHYRIMHLEEALTELYSQEPVREHEHRRLPLVLTFDDGYQDNYTEGFRLAQRYRIPVTIFVIPGYITSGQYFWWLASAQLVQQLPDKDISFENKTYQLPTQRLALSEMIDKRIRHTTSVAEREALLVDIQLQLGVKLPVREADIAGQAVDPLLPLTWAQIREMEATGWISFGAHTVNHPILSYLSDPAEVLYEVQASRAMLEEQLGHPVRSFAYPIGKFQHIGKQGLLAVQTAGYRWAVTTIEDINASQADPLWLARMPGNIDVHWIVMAAELVGLLGVVSRVRKKYARFFKK